MLIAAHIGEGNVDKMMEEVESALNAAGEGQSTAIYINYPTRPILPMSKNNLTK